MSYTKTEYGDLFYEVAVYYTIKGDPTNEKYYQLAAEHGNVDAANILYNKIEITNADDKNEFQSDNTIIHIFAADDGYVESMYKLGNYYKKVNNTRYMLYYYKSATRKGHDKAMYELGKYYQEQNSITNMLKFYTLSINKGNAYAMFQLAEYYKGLKDYPNMVKYYELGANSRHAKSVRGLISHYLELNDITKVINYYELLIDIAANGTKYH